MANGLAVLYFVGQASKTQKASDTACCRHFITQCKVKNGCIQNHFYSHSVVFGVLCLCTHIVLYLLECEMSSIQVQS